MAGKYSLTLQLQLQSPNNVARVVSDLQKQLGGVAVNLQVKNSKQAAQQVQQLTKATNDAKTAAEKMGDAFGVSLKRFAAFSLASRAIGVFTRYLSNAIDESINFDRQLNKIKQVTRASAGQLGDLSKEITRLATTFGVASSEITDTALILAQAGLSATDTKIALEALTKTRLSATFGDINETAEGAVALIAQFGEGAGALERQLGALNAVSAKFAVESADLIEVIRRTGGVFKASGGSLEELFGLFTSVRATTRESAESIATALKTIFTRLQRPQTIQYLKDLGVELVNAEGAFVGPYEAIRRLSTAFGSLEQGSLKFIEIAEELGGYRQIGKVIPLLQQFTTAEKARQAAISGGNSLTEEAAIAQESLAVQFQKVREEFLALIRSTTQTDTFKILTKTVLSLATSLIKVADALKPVIPLLAAFAAIKFTRNIGGFFGGIGAALQKRQFGGKIHKFASGGMVPGSGNRDTVPAMLTPGEFVIRKSSVNKLGAGTLAAMNENRYDEGGLASETRKAVQIARSDKKFRGSTQDPIQRVNLKFPKDTNDLYGGAFLSPVGDVEDLTGKVNSTAFLNKIKGKSKDTNFSTIRNNWERLSTNQKRDIESYAQENLDFKIASAALEEKFAVTVEDKIFDGVLKSVQEGATFFSEQTRINTSSFSGGEAANLLRKTNIDNIIGNIFEAILLNSGSPYISTEKDASNSTWDFPDGLGKNVASKFDDRLAKIKTDAKTRFTVGNINSLKNKVEATEAEKIRKGIEQAVNGLPFKVGSGVPIYETEFGSDVLAAKKAGYRVTGQEGEDKLYSKFFGGAIRKFAAGGAAPSDTVPALLTPGEFVFSKKAAQSIGYGALNKMNKQGVAGYAKGGPVSVQKFAKGGGPKRPLETDPDRLVKFAKDRKNQLENELSLAKAKYSVAEGVGNQKATDYYGKQVQELQKDIQTLSNTIEKNSKSVESNTKTKDEDVANNKNEKTKIKSKFDATSAIVGIGILQNTLVQMAESSGYANDGLKAFSNGLIQFTTTVGIIGAQLKSARDQQAEIEAQGGSSKIFGMSRKGIINVAGGAAAGLAGVGAVGSAVGGYYSSRGEKNYQEAVKTGDVEKIKEAGKQNVESQVMGQGLSGLSDVGTFASIGAMLGSIFGPVGTAVGALVGALGGLVAWYIKWQNINKEAIKEEQNRKDAEAITAAVSGKVQKAFKEIESGAKEFAGPNGLDLFTSTIIKANQDQSEALQKSGISRDMQEKSQEEINQRILQSASIIARRSQTEDEAKKTMEKLAESSNLTDEELQRFKNQAVNTTVTMLRLKNAQEELIKINLENSKISSIFNAASLSVDNFINSLEVGSVGLTNSIKILELAANNINLAPEGEKAINDIESAILSNIQMSSSQSDTGALSNMISSQADRARLGNAITSNISKNLENLQLVSGGDVESSANKEKVSDAILSSLPEGVDPNTQKKLKDIISSQLKDLDLSSGTVNFDEIIKSITPEINSALIEPFANTGKIIDKQLQDLARLTKARIEIENKLVETQKNSLELQLESQKTIAEFGGKKVTPADEFAIRARQFDIGGRAAGIGTVGAGTAEDIRRVSEQVRTRFASQQSQFGGVANAGGAADLNKDQRERLKKANQDLIALTRQRIEQTKQELQIIKEKNALEKSSIDKLLGGDVEGFMQDQAAASAAQALRSGNTDMLGMFSAQTLGQAAKSLEGQLTPQEFASALGPVLGRFGIQDSRSAQVYAGATQEEQTLMQRGQQEAGLLAELGQNEVGFAQMELKSAEMNIQTANVIFREDINTMAKRAAAQGLAKGGVVYANRGIFVPRGTDTVPAMLTPGEFVVRREAVQSGNNLQILQAMNRSGGVGGVLSNGVQALAGGGTVQNITNNNNNVNVDQFSAAVNKLQEAISQIPREFFHQFNGSTSMSVTGLAGLTDVMKNIASDAVTQMASKMKTDVTGNVQINGSVLG